MNFIEGALSPLIDPLCLGTICKILKQKGTSTENMYNLQYSLFPLHCRISDALLIIIYQACIQLLTIRVPVGENICNAVPTFVNINPPVL